MSPREEVALVVDLRRKDQEIDEVSDGGSVRNLASGQYAAYPAPKGLCRGPAEFWSPSSSRKSI